MQLYFLELLEDFNQHKKSALDRRHVLGKGNSSRNDSSCKSSGKAVLIVQVEKKNEMCKM